MTLKVRDKMILKRFVDDAPAGWSTAAIVAAAGVDGGLIEIVQIERGGADVLARDLSSASMIVRSEAEILETFQRVDT